MPKYDWLNIAAREVDQVARGRLLNEIIARIAPYTNAMTGDALADAGLAEVVAGSFGGSAPGVVRYATSALKRAAAYAGATVVYDEALKRFEYTPGDGTFSALTDQRVGHVTPYAYGAYADNTSHPITQADIDANALYPASSDERWRGTYAVGDEWDYVATQEAIYRAFAGTSTPGTITWNNVSSAHLNRELRLSSGRYFFGQKTPLINDLFGGRIIGDGAKSTLLTADRHTTILKINGVSNTLIDGIGFYGRDYTYSNARGKGYWMPSTTYNPGDRIATRGGTQTGFGYLNNARGTLWICTAGGTSGATEPAWVNGSVVSDGAGTLRWEAVTNLSGVRPGIVPLLLMTYDGSGFNGTCQSNMIQNCHFETDGSLGHNVGLQITDSQSSQGSEFTVLRCQFIRFHMAAALQEDFDALQNTFIGCNFSDCWQGGLVGLGAFFAVSCGFQNGRYHATYQQELTQLGPDIYSLGGAMTTLASRDCRSESAQHYVATSGPAHVQIENFEHNPNGVVSPDYNRSSAIALGALTIGNGGATPDGFLYECTTAGTTGATQPNWPGYLGATVNDGTVVWTQNDYSTIRADNLSMLDSQVFLGHVFVGSPDLYASSVRHCVFSRAKWHRNQTYYRKDNWISPKGWTAVAAFIPDTNCEGYGQLEYKKLLVGTATWDPVSLASGASTTTTVTVTGAVVGDTVEDATHSQLSTIDARLIARVTAANTVTVKLINDGAGALDVASGTLRVVVRTF